MFGDLVEIADTPGSITINFMREREMREINAFMITAFEQIMAGFARLNQTDAEFDMSVASSFVDIQDTIRDLKSSLISRKALIDSIISEPLSDGFRLAPLWKSNARASAGDAEV